MASVDIYPYVFVAPGPKFTDSDDVKFDYAEQSALSINLEDYPEGNEMLGFIAYFTGPLSNSSDISVKGSFYNNATNALLFSGEIKVPTPQSAGGDWWDWYKVKFWIGHASWEINSAMRVRMEVNISGGGFPTTLQTVYQEVKTKPVKPAFVNRINGTVTAKPFFTPLTFAKVTYSNWSAFTNAQGYYEILDPLPVIKLITAELEGYETQTKTIVPPLSGTLTVDFALSTAVLPPPEIPWYEKWFGWTLSDIQNLIFLNPIADILALSKVLENLLPESWTAYKVQFPTWLYELGLWLFFAPAFTTAVEGMIKSGATSTEANSIVTAIKDKGFIKALDIMKANPLKYADDFKALDPLLASQILKGMSKDQLAGLATNVFKASWDEGLIKTAPLWKQAMFAAAKHKWLGFTGLVAFAGLIMGYDSWGNWSIVDNLQFMSGKTADQIKASFLDGSMTKEKALEELRMLLAIAKEGDTKVKTSTYWNIFQILFAPLWDELAALTVNKLETVIAEIEGTPPPAATGTLTISPIPADAKVSVTGQIPTTGTFSQLLPIGFYSWVVSKFGYVSESGTSEVKENLTASVSVTLSVEPTPPTEEATLTIVTQPADAKVEIAAYPEITAAGTYIVAPGTYSIKISKTDYKDYVATVYLNAGDTKTISIILSYVGPVVPPIPPEPIPPEPEPIPEIPITIPLEPAEPYVPPVYNAWKYTIHAIDSETEEELYAQLLVDGVSQTGYTPMSIYLLPESRYILTLRKKGYKQGVVEVITEALPTT